MKIFDLDKLVATLTGYIETKIELLKLDAKEESERIIGKLAVVLLTAMAVIFALLFFSAALAVFLGEFLESVVLGYLVVGGLYGIVALIIYSQRDNLQNRTKRLNDRESEE